jgi:hypothetical protein
MAASRLYEAVIRAAKSGDVRRAAAEVVFTLAAIAAREFMGAEKKGR